MATITIDREEHLRLLEAQDALHRIIKDVVEPFQDGNREPAEPEQNILDGHPLVLIGNGLYAKKIMGEGGKLHVV